MSTRQAGQTVRCQCGAVLEVPTLRGLADLERIESSGPRADRAWGNRHRVVFAFLVGAIASFALAGFMAVRMPAKIELPVVSIDADTPILMVYEVYYDLQRGIDVDPPQLTEVGREQVRLREQLLWGIRIALGLGGMCTVAAIAVVLSAPSQKR
jgi:hypothetical protein